VREGGVGEWLTVGSQGLPIRTAEPVNVRLYNSSECLFLFSFLLSVLSLFRLNLSFKLLNLFVYSYLPLLVLLKRTGV
jgi:hypothetical protein